MSGTDLAIAIPAALASALTFGFAAALQHRESGEVEKRGALDPGLLSSLARRPLWLVGIGADVLAVGLQTVGLRFGPVSLVQPLLVAGLPFAVLLSCLLARRPPRTAEVLGISLCAVGLAVLAPAATAVGLAPEPQRSAAWVAAVAATALTLALLGVARVRPRLAGVATGAAAGVVTGAGSVLLAVCAGRLGRPVDLLLSIAPYAAVVVGGLGLLLCQVAFQTGDLGAPLAALSVLEPATAVVLAVTVLHERLPTQQSAEVGLAGVGAALVVLGVVLLARTQARWEELADAPKM
ncbi:MAG TPA: DMT family transporter [Frankiaceae bacterium]|nr:DMT family transporter [Frankiaceae bacterium]